MQVGKNLTFDFLLIRESCGLSCSVFLSCVAGFARIQAENAADTPEFWRIQLLLNDESCERGRTGFDKGMVTKIINLENITLPCVAASWPPTLDHPCNINSYMRL